MKKLIFLLFLIPHFLHAQANIAGLLYASNFAGWSVPQGNQGQFSWTSPSFCTVTSGGATFRAFAVGVPVTLNDAEVPSNTEVITPIQANYSGFGCSISATTTHPHKSFYFTTATAGLGEALTFAGSAKYQVVLTPDWTRLGGQTSTVTSSTTGNTSVTILDQRTADLSYYTWSGSAYVNNTFGGGTGLPTASAIGQVPTSTAAGTTYTAQIPLGGTTWYYPVEWYGAVGDATGATGVGTDNTIAIQACLTAVAAAGKGQCLLQAKKYRITSPVTISASSVGIAGQSYGAFSTSISNQLAANVPVSGLVIDSPTANAVKASGASISAPISFNRFNDFTMIRAQAATTTGSGGCGASGNLGGYGLALEFAGGWQISNVWSQDSACGIYLLNAGAFGTGYIENSGVLWGFNVGCPTIPVYGIFVDGGQSAESLRIRHSFAETNNCPGQQSVGLIATGADLNDLFVDNFETAFVTFGKYIQFTTGGCTVCSSDIHLINSVDDTFFTTGTTITGLTQANGCAVEISGGWESSNGTGDGVAIASSCGVTVDHVHFLFNNGMANGVHATSSGQIGISNNYFLVEATAATAVINLNTVANATVTGNVIAGKSGSTQTDILCVSCTRSVFTGNTLSGFAATGISMDAGSTNNSFLGVNAIDPTNITTQVSNLGTNNTFDGVGGLIAKKTGTGTPTSITFSSIPQTYQNLKLMGNFVLTGGANLVANFNGDSTAAHYAYGLNYENNGSTGQTASNSSTHALIAGAQGAVEMEIPSYTAGVGGGVNFTGNFSAMTIGSATLSGAVGGLWNGTDVTSLTLADSSGTAAFTAGSVFSLYGLN